MYASDTPRSEAELCVCPYTPRSEAEMCMVQHTQRSEAELCNLAYPYSKQLENNIIQRLLCILPLEIK